MRLTFPTTCEMNEATPKRSLFERLFTRRAGGMLVRNTIVSTGTFLIGLGVLWLLVDKGGMNEVIAAGASFIVANSIHYVLGRSWIFKGTTRDVATGYAMFLGNGVVGLLLTMGLMAAFLAWTPLHYLLARVLVSIVAGLTIFVLNAVWTFGRL